MRGVVELSVVSLVVVLLTVVACGGGGSAGGGPRMTEADFHLSGTQIGDVSVQAIWKSTVCQECHAGFDPPHEPYATWKGSLMGNAGRDPLFLAQLATAEQDVPGVGNFCLRCHVPMTFVTGHAAQSDGSTQDDVDRDGVTCHFCHSMVDPIYEEGVSPPEDLAILAGLASVPRHYGNSMFVLDPSGTRRGPSAYPAAPHDTIQSKFHRTSDLCGTCHDVGNVALTRQPDGTYALNTPGEPTPDENPHSQFPLERTYTEWKLSAFANGGVDMGGLFGGLGMTVVSTCQDCHMPKAMASACSWSPPRADLAVHEFAGAAEWVLEIIPLAFWSDPDLDVSAIEAGKARARSMLQRAASLELSQQGGTLEVRVINETGHKLPTGHIEGRRAWANVRFLDASDAVVGEHGAYDPSTAQLDEASTRVWEMHIGISERQSEATGVPAGTTTHMSLADVIVKDTRIPPRGFDNAAFEAGGAPVVGVQYADGQYWDDQFFTIPAGAVKAEVTVYYQIVTRHYIEALRDGNQTNDWGMILHALWLLTNKAAPTPITTATLTLAP